MPLDITRIEFNGGKELDKALEKLADSKTNGNLWKRRAMTESGKAAMRRVSIASKSKAPYKSGHTKRTIGMNVSYYGNNVEKAYTKKGKLKKGRQHELRVTVDLKTRKFNQNAPKDRKGKPIRYPYMLELGVPSQRYARTSKNGVVHDVNRLAPRKPLYFFHNALGKNKGLVVSSFKSQLGRLIELFARSTATRPSKKIIYTSRG